MRTRVGKPVETRPRKGPAPESRPETGERASFTLLIFRLARATGYRLGEALAGLDMRTHEFAVLHHLRQAGPLSQQELGGALRINPSNLVGLLDALQEDGLIVRPRDPTDRRRHVVELTAAGQLRLAEAKQAVAAAEHDLLAPLTEAERSRLQAVLERLASHTCTVNGGKGRGC
jgi:MarR family transcriptional regulator, lower aerobic nicotinate degradation pathway regulator